MVEIYYHSSQPVVGFDGLSNRGDEGDEYILKPVLNEHHLCQDYVNLRPKTVARYSAAATWLQWDEEKAAFTGKIPSWCVYLAYTALSWVTDCPLGKRPRPG